jgi:hypothetical protein
MHYTMFPLAHIRSFIIDHTEPELKVSTEQAQSEELTNLTLDQDKPRCI